VETGFYDGFALAALLVALALASEHTDDDPSRWAWFVARTEGLSVAIGVAVGAVGGLIITRSLARRWMSDTWAQLATLAVALLCFQVGEMVHASGFVSAYVGGLAYAAIARHEGTQLSTQFTGATAQLLELTVFALFGGYAVIIGWRDANWRVVVFAVLALFVVRLIAVSLALLGSDLAVRSRCFIGWFGPRGIGTVVLGLLVIDSGNIQNDHLITQVVVVTVTLSLVVHSITAPFGIRWVSGDRLSDQTSQPAEPARG
jgi:NhaP-type Na+/H+ or K+/H+ antiporter